MFLYDFSNNRDAHKSKAWMNVFLPISSTFFPWTLWSHYCMCPWADDGKTDLQLWQSSNSWVVNRFFPNYANSLGLSHVKIDAFRPFFLRVVVLCSTHRDYYGNADHKFVIVIAWVVYTYLPLDAARKAKLPKLLSFLLSLSSSLRSSATITFLLLLHRWDDTCSTGIVTFNGGGW